MRSRVKELEMGCMMKHSWGCGHTNREAYDTKGKIMQDT